VAEKSKYVLFTDEELQSLNLKHPRRSKWGVVDADAI
jgi:hypothetical protein